MRLSTPIQFKASPDAPQGVIVGLASTFGGQPDSYGDVVAPGAFGASIKQHQSQATMPAMLWAHDQSEPCGKWLSLEETANGLTIKGKLTLDTKRGQEAFALARDGALALSIGYTIPAGGASYDKSSRILKQIDLHEVSLVSMPANPLAKITGVKLFETPDSIRDFEHQLRDALGFSAREAKKLASGGWAALSERDARDSDLAELMAEIKRLTQQISLKGF